MCANADLSEFLPAQNIGIKGGTVDRYLSRFFAPNRYVYGLVGEQNSDEECFNYTFWIGSNIVLPEYNEVYLANVAFNVIVKVVGTDEETLKEADEIVNNSIFYDLKGQVGRDEYGISASLSYRKV